jgi:dTDP-4-amino-4,6-dideoxygalactose transaminase
VTELAVRRVPFLALARATEESRREIDQAVARVLDSSWFVLGREVEAFEAALSSLCGVNHAVGTASGTDALEIALRTLDIGRGHEVITQANTCVPTVAAILRAGATPVLCDADPDTATMDPDSLRTAISRHSRAVVPVHLYGQCADMEAVCAVASKHGIAVVEDCAQALGARTRERPAGSHGAIAAFSFYPTKNLGALGDAGAIVTADPALGERARRIRQYGTDAGGRSVEDGINSRLDEIQAAVLRAKLPLLEQWTARRREIADRYDAVLSSSHARPLTRLPGHMHAFHLYVVCVRERDAFRAELERNGVETLVHYPTPIHMHPAYRRLARESGALAGAEQLAREVVSLPLYPQLTDEEIDHVTNAVIGAAHRSA